MFTHSSEWILIDALYWYVNCFTLAISTILLTLAVSYWKGLNDLIE